MIVGSEPSMLFDICHCCASPTRSSCCLSPQICSRDERTENLPTRFPFLSCLLVLSLSAALRVCTYSSLAEMTLLRTLLITYPLTPISLVDHLRTLFPVVHFYPGVAGNDYNATASVLPTSEVFASADVLLTFGLPTNLKHWSQTPNLKLLQCVGAGVNQITDTAYWESVPDSSPVVLANSTGIHVPAISEHGQSSLPRPSCMELMEKAVMMTVMALYHKLLESTDIARNEKRWAAPKELGGMFIQE